MGKYFLLLLLIAQELTFGQILDTSKIQLQNVPSKFFENTNEKIASLDKQVADQTTKYLSNLSREEEVLAKKLNRYDSAAAKLIGNASQKYNALSQKINTTTTKATKILSGQYIPYLDSLECTLSFIKQSKAFLTESKKIQDQISQSLQKISELKDKLNQTEQIKQILQERQEQIRQLLSKYTDLPKSISKYFGKYQQDVYYYSQQIRDLRGALNDPVKLEEKLLQTLNKFSAFRDFVAKNSMLASLFAPAGIPGVSTFDPTLQTRVQVQQLVQQRALAGGPNGQQLINQQVQQAQGQLTQLKNKLNQLGGSPDGDLNMPNFKPNEQKTKPFLKRLEYGMNMQSSRGNSYFPVTTDFGFSLGYKLNAKSILGIGASYKMGWGKDWNHISISVQGVGLRSFVEWKVKGNFWLSGGAEMNYMRRVTSLEIFKNYTTWQKSALLGMSKKYALGKKWKGNVQVLYDFLALHHVPRTDPFLFRVGYSL